MKAANLERKLDLKEAQLRSANECVRDLQADVVSYNAVIDACAKHGDVDRAEAWLRRVLRDGVQANVVSCNTVVDACAKHCDVDKAEALVLAHTS